MQTQRRQAPRTATVAFQHNAPLSVVETPHYWHPQRFGVQFAPAAFRSRLQHEFGPEVDVTWWPSGSRWLIWQREPTVTHRTCPGWSLKIVWQGYQDRFLPLDERIFANLYVRQLWRYPGAGKGYFERIEGEIAREQAASVRHSKGEAEAKTRELIDARQIKNIGAGNKFALHHDGTIVPSRSEANWWRELQRTRQVS